MLVVLNDQVINLNKLEILRKSYIDDKPSIWLCGAKTSLHIGYDTEDARNTEWEKLLAKVEMRG